MSKLRIKDAQLLPDVNGSEKIPTGGRGDLAISMEQVKTFAQGGLPQQINAHVNNTENPHNVTKAQVGLGEVDNTSDVNKPISTATQEALDLKANTLDVDNSLNLKANIEDVDSALNLKSDKTYVDAQDSLKADKTYVDSRDLLKADKVTTYTKTEVDGSLGFKADKTYVDSALTGFSNGAAKFYPTLAEANADIANIALKDKVEVGEAVNGGTWYKATAGATSLTKSAYDPLTQAKNYTNTFVNTRNNLADSFLYAGVLTNADDLNPLRKDGTFIATSVPVNAPTGETGSAFITIKTGGSFTHQTYQRLSDSRYRYERVVQRVTADNFVAEAWRDISFLSSANIATTSKVGTVKPSTGLTIGSDGSLSVANLARSQLADDFTYVGNLNETNDLNIKMKEGSYLTLAVPLNAPADINPNVLITNQNVGQRYIQTIYDLIDSRKRWLRVVRFNNDGTLNSAEEWRNLYSTHRDGLTDNFMYNGVFTSATDLNAEHKQGLYISTSLPTNAPVGAPSVSFIEIDRAQSFVKQTLTDVYDASKRWQRNMQVGGLAREWVNLDPLSNVASQSKLGVIKAGAGLNVTPDGTLNVIAPTQANIFAGKKIVCFGDSITELKTYPQQLGQILGAEGINVGFGGCQMSAHLWDDGYREMCMYRLADYVASGDYSGLIAAAQDVYERKGDDNRAIVARLAAIDWNTVDYITILYGTNDFAESKSIGVATDVTSDGSNFLGSANYAVQQLQTAYPHLKIAFITPIYRARGRNGGTDSDDSPDANGKYLSEYAAGLVEVAKLNHIPCFNLLDESGINKYTAPLYLNPPPDGVHLTEAGATFLAQKIAAKMRANF